MASFVENKLAVITKMGQGELHLCRHNSHLLYYNIIMASADLSTGSTRGERGW